MSTVAGRILRRIIQEAQMSTNVSVKAPVFPQVQVRRGLVFGMIIITALLAFEIFNYSTTEYALSDLLGGLQFAGIRWATILSIAFCGIDFAGIARLFTPQDGAGDNATPHSEIWYLLGAWLLAATMNAMLTWWGVSLAVLGHETLGNAVVERATLLRVVPIFVALLVWLIRVLIIGTFSVAGDHLFKQEELRFPGAVRPQSRPATAPPAYSNRPQPMRSGAPIASAPRPASMKSNSAQLDLTYQAGRQEPTYHPLSAKPASNQTHRSAQGIHASPNRSGGSYRQ